MQTSAFSIRPLDTRDLAAALSIQSKTYPAHLLEDVDAFASRLNATTPFCLAATQGGSLVAYLLAHGWPREAPPPLGKLLPAQPVSEVLLIHDLAVSPAGRGSRIGRALVTHAFEMAGNKGLFRAELVAVAGAASYWRALGFDEAPISAEFAAKLAAYGPDARWMTRDIPAVRTAHAKDR